jgi:hypothetical protein
MEPSARELADSYVAERRSALDQIEAGWAAQSRRPTADEVDIWISASRSRPYFVDTAFL